MCVLDAFCHTGETRTHTQTLAQRVARRASKGGGGGVRGKQASEWTRTASLVGRKLSVAGVRRGDHALCGSKAGGRPDKQQLRNRVGLISGWRRRARWKVLSGMCVCVCVWTVPFSGAGAAARGGEAERARSREMMQMEAGEKGKSM